MLQTGIKGTKYAEVKQENTAQALGSGLLPVYATPAMVLLMESTAAGSVETYLEEGQGTVGTALQIRHVSATPIGEKVWCDSELIEIEGKKLLFSVKAFDKAGLIGEGTHERYIINNERFMEKASSKSKQND